MSATVAPSARRYGLGLWAAAYLFLVQMAFSTAPSPLYVLYARRDRFSSLMITLIYAAYAIGVLASLLLISHRSDVHGRRPHLLAALALALLSAVVFLAWPTLAGLLIARVLFGVAAGLTMATVSAYISELFRSRYPHGSPSRAQLIVAAANLGGLALGAGMAGLLAQYVPHPLTVPYLVLVAMLLLAAIGVLLAPETRPRTRPVPAYHPQRVSVPDGARPQFLAALTGIFFGFATPAVFIGLAGTFLATVVHQRSLALAGAAIFIVFSVGVALASATSAWAPHRRLAAGLALAITGLALIVIAAWLPTPSLALFLIGGGFIGGASAALFKGTLATVVAISPHEKLGETLASYYVSAYIGLSIPAIGVGIALQFLTPATTLLAFAIAVTIGLLAASRTLLRAHEPTGTKTQQPLQLRPELQAAVEQRAATERVTVPDIVEHALRDYLHRTPT